MSDVRDLLVRLEEDVRRVQPARPSDVRLAGARRRRRERAIAAVALLLVAALATGLATWGHLLVAPPPTAPVPRGDGTVSIGNWPGQLALDAATDTLYVVPAEAPNLWLVDAGACNAGHLSGCPRSPRPVFLQGQPAAVVVDGRTGTVYEPGFERGLLVLDEARCSQSDHSPSGCEGMRVTTVGGSPAMAALDAHGVLFVASQMQPTINDIPQFADPAVPGSAVPPVQLFALATSGCKARVSAGCGQLRSLGTVSATPVAMAVDPGTGTVYLETNDDRGRGVLWLAGGTGCATATGSCAHLHPVMTLGSFDLDHPVPKVGFVIDEATHTLFAGVPSDRAVALLDTARCRATSTVCPPPTMVGVDRVPGTLGLDPTDDRVFVAGADSPGVLVLDGRRCHAAAASGCASASSVIQVRDATGHQVTAAAFAVDVRHGTLFVADGQAGTVVATSLP